MPSRARWVRSSARLMWRCVCLSKLTLRCWCSDSISALARRLAGLSISFFQQVSFPKVSIYTEFGRPIEKFIFPVITIHRKCALDAAARLGRAVNLDGAAHVLVQAAACVEIAPLAGQLVEQEQEKRGLR